MSFTDTVKAYAKGVASAITAILAGVATTGGLAGFLPPELATWLTFIALVANVVAVVGIPNTKAVTADVVDETKVGE